MQPFDKFSSNYPTCFRFLFNSNFLNFFLRQSAIYSFFFLWFSIYIKLIILSSIIVLNFNDFSTEDTWIFIDFKFWSTSKDCDNFPLFVIIEKTIFYFFFSIIQYHSVAIFWRYNLMWCLYEYGISEIFGAIWETFIVNNRGSDINKCKEKKIHLSIWQSFLTLNAYFTCSFSLRGFFFEFLYTI